MTAPLNVTQKLATAKSWQNTGTNLNEFQTWLGVFPHGTFQYSDEQVAIAGPTDGTIYVRRPGMPTLLLNPTDWLVITNLTNPQWTKVVDQDYQQSWG